MDVEGTVTMDIETAPIDESHSVGSPRIEHIAVHSSFLPGIVDGMNRDADVFLAFSSKGLEREMVSYVIVREPTGGHHLAGIAPLKGKRSFVNDLARPMTPGWLM